MVFHDLGKRNDSSLYTHTWKQWFPGIALCGYWVHFVKNDMGKASCSCVELFIMVLYLVISSHLYSAFLSCSLSTEFKAGSTGPQWWGPSVEARGVHVLLPCPCPVTERDLHLQFPNSHWRMHDFCWEGFILSRFVERRIKSVNKSPSSYHVILSTNYTLIALK